MEVERLQLFQFVDVLCGFFLDFFLISPEVGIFGQVLGIDSHLDDLTILLQLSEDIAINSPSIIDICKVLMLLLLLPISE